MVDRLVKEVFIEERSSSAAPSTSETVKRYESGPYVARYLQLNTLARPLLFVAVHQRMMPLAYVDAMMQEWAAQFAPLAKQIVPSLLQVDTSSGLEQANSMALSSANGYVGSPLPAEKREAFASSLEAWVPTFSALVRRHERSSHSASFAGKNLTVPGSVSVASVSGESEGDAPMPEAKPQTAEEKKAAQLAAIKARLASGGPAGLRGKNSTASSASSGAASPTPEKQGKKKKGGGKEMRKWDADGRSMATDQDDSALDFSTSSAPSDPVHARAAAAALIDKSSMGRTDANGMYEVADFQVQRDEGVFASSSSSWMSKFTTGGDSGGGLLSRFSGGGSGALTKNDLAPALQAMQQHLQAKNVASDVASRLCAGVEARLVGRPRSSWWSLDGGAQKMVRSALADSIARVLTPRSSTDILAEISARRTAQEAQAAVAATRSTKAATGQTYRPYTIAFVGVNGVGKSTNLSKVAFWLLQNQLRVLVAACDTFRAGAVEQLRVHVRNLGQLHSSASGGISSVTNADGSEPSEGKDIALFEAGYGRDAASLAGQAITAGEKGGYDVVLIDTAGRMQDNEPLMRALARLVQVNNPDKILFVGEALTGNEAVDQLSRFDGALKDLGGGDSARGLDGMILTKFDTSTFTTVPALRAVCLHCAIDC